MKKTTDSYSVYARFLPSIASSLPFFVIWFFLAENARLSSLGSFLLSIQFFGSVTLSVAGLYFYAQMLRITSKYFEGLYFTKSKGFPTTYLMMYENDTFSDSYKDTYRSLVKKHFDMDLLTKDDEETQKAEARKRLNEVAKQAILKVGDGRLVKKQNIWYGFSRNLVGGAIYSTIFCIVGLVISALTKNGLLAIILACLIIPYGALLLFRKSILTQTGEAYAQQLIAEFISIG
ncbi:hypothetical protein ACFL6U_17500 [Planctomycetota bacterium]